MWGRYRVCFDLTKPVVVIDFETTGLRSRKHKIIEIAAARLLPNESRAPLYHKLVRPPRKLSPKIVELTGITDELIARDGVDACEAIGGLVDFVGSDPIISYNADFDLAFLNAACDEHSFSVEKKGGHSCALKLVRKVIPGLPSYRLGEVARTLRLDTSDTHRAVGDTLRAAQIYRICAADYLSRRAR